MKQRNHKRDKKQPKGDYKIGYARTPDETKFKPGNEFGRRGGRPKGRKNDATLLKEIFDHKVEITVPGGQPQRATMRQVMLWKLALRAATGADTKAFNVITNYARELGVLSLPPPPPPEHLAPDEAADLEWFIQTIAAERGLLPPPADDVARPRDVGAVEPTGGGDTTADQSGRGNASAGQRKSDGPPSTVASLRTAYRVPGRPTVVRVDFSQAAKTPARRTSIDRASADRKQGGVSP